MTMAVFTLPSASAMALRAAERSTPAASMTMRWLRSTSLSFQALRSTIRLPYVFPSRIMAPVVSVFNTSFVAVPAFIRVDPVTISGPTRTVMQMSQLSRSSRGGSEHDRNTVRAPSTWARARAAPTYGVVPLAAMPTTTSFLPTPREFTSRSPAPVSSSAPSMDLTRAAGPPAISPTTISGGVPKVGGHSAASSTPSRPLVPAPT
jgi:hypothetical protein